MHDIDIIYNINMSYFIKFWNMSKRDKEKEYKEIKKSRVEKISFIEF